jgi:6-phosphogluconolactonase
MSPKRRPFNTASAAVDALCAAVTQDLEAAIVARGRASLALSGGRSPVPFLQALARQPIDWDRVVVSLVDERWVPATHADSNHGLVEQHLLAQGAADATFVPLWASSRAPQEQAAWLSEGHGIGVRAPIDVAVLGMGEDGHTASWFPDAPELAIVLTTTCAYIATAPAQGRQARITLTLSALSRVRSLYLAIAGEAKRHLLARAIAEGYASGLPVAHILTLPTLTIIDG